MQIAIYESIRGILLYDFSNKAFDREFGTNEYGFNHFSFSIDIPLNIRAVLQKYRKVAHVRLGFGNSVIWEGRLEEVQLENEVTRVIARGYIQAFTDLQVTDIWSTTDYSLWKPSIKERTFQGLYDDEKFNFDTNGRLLIGVKSNNKYGNNPWVIGGLELLNLSGSTRKFNTISFVGSGVINSDFNAGIAARDSPMTGGDTVINVVTGTPITPTLFFTNKDCLQFYLYRFNTNALFIGEDNDINFTISGLRVGTTTTISGGRLYADEILKYTLSGVYSLNSNQINPTTIYIQSPQVDLKDVMYVDQTGLDVINSLIEKPDSQSRYWECKVWENQTVYFQPQKTRYKTWYVNLSDLKVGRVLSKFYNKTRAKYKDTNDTELRTAYTTNDTSIRELGIKRENLVDIDTTDSTLAGYAVTASLSDTARQKTQTGIDTRWVYTIYGAKVPAYNVRSGDKIIIRNIPVVLFDEIESEFYLKETIYNIDERIATLVPQEPIPSLVTLLQQIG